MNYAVSQLPPIDEVEIVPLGDEDDAATLQQNLQMPCVRVGGETAQNLARLWRHLPPAAQMRCHIPPYGFRFYQQGQSVLVASVCWKCNNIWLIVKSEQKLYEFDAQHSIAQELLAMAEQLTSLLRHTPDEYSLEQRG